MINQNKSVRTTRFEGGYAARAGSLFELNVKIMHMARANAAAALDLAHQIVTADKASDLPSVWADYFKKQIELLTSQAVELTSLGQKIGAAGKSEAELEGPEKQGQVAAEETEMPRFEALHLFRLAEDRKKKTE